MDLLLEIGNFVVYVVVGIGGYVFRMIFTQLKELELKNQAAVEQVAATRRELDLHKLHVAETYTTKMDLRDMESRLVDHLVRIEHKLDGKQDKE